MVERPPRLETTGAPGADASFGNGRGLDETLPSEGGTPRASTDASEPLSRGSTVGRYTVLDRIGSGGMGVVYSAFDPQLDRRIALKVMHAEDGGSGASGGKSRLLREAQAMAKLAHPNVITVHDVGTFGDRVFVAMEFIEGCTLRQWVKYGDHEWPEIVEAFVKAGRGLAAAHAAGLVHRDFKPDNVLMGNDGRVLVMDFGLARQASLRTGPVGTDVTGDRSASDRERVDVEVMLTRSGALLGTPAYMAPEQHKGGPVGPGADQFGFCVALYEALYGERPFGGNSVTSIALNVLDGQIKAPPRDSRVPSWLRQVVLRGLRVQAEDRYPSMDALLAELQRDPPTGSRPWLAVSTALVVAGAIIVTWLIVDSRRVDETCKDEAQRLAGSWDEGAQSEVREALLGSEISYADATWQSVSDRLDAYATTWARTFAERCEIDRKRRSSGSDRDRDQGLACLQARRAEFDALVEALLDPQPSTIEHAVSAAQRLRSPEVCAEVDAMAGASGILSDRTMTRADPDGRSPDLARAEVLVHLSRPAQAMQLLNPLMAAPHRDDPVLQAEVLALTGRVQAQLGELGAAERSSRDSVLSAATVRRFDLEASSWLEMVRIVGLHQDEYDEARRLALAAEAAISRAGNPADLRAELLATLGAIDQAQGRYDDALDHWEQALALRESSLPADDLRLAQARQGVGLAMEGLARFEDAIEQHSAALTLREQVLGAHHPQVAVSLVRLGASMHGVGRTEAAEAALIRARMLLDPRAEIALDDLPAPGATAPTEPHDKRKLQTRLELGPTLDHLGLIHRSKEEFSQAARLHARAAALVEKRLGPDHADLGYPLENLGLSLADQDRHGEALTHLRRALDVWERELDPDHPDLGFAHLNLANSLWATGHSQEAGEHYGKALAIWEETLPHDHPLLAYALTGLGRVHLADQPRTALELLERASSIRNDEDEDRLNVAETSLLLGRALWTTGQDQRRAFELAIIARDLVGAYEPTEVPGLRAVLEGSEVERFTDQLAPAGLGVSNRRML